MKALDRLEEQVLVLLRIEMDKEDAAEAVKEYISRCISGS